MASVSSMFEQRNEHRAEEADIELLLFKQEIWQSGEPNIYGNLLMVRFINPYGIHKVRPPRKFFSDPHAVIEMEYAIYAQRLWKPYVEALLPHGGKLSPYEYFELIRIDPAVRAKALLKVLRDREAA